MKADYILIAEDDEDDRFLLVSAFSEIARDISLVFVTDGIELMEHFTKIENGEVNRLPSLLIVDLNMPKKNGREALKELLNKPYFNNFKILIFSTTANEFEKQRCSELGFNDFYVKPSNYSSLLDLVRRFRDLAV